MIVVIGSLRLRGAGENAEPVGLAASIATAAATDRGLVEVIARVGDDPAGDALLLSLARHRVGHAAVLRDAGRRTVAVVEAVDTEVTAPEAEDVTAADEGPRLEAADANLALRYLPQISVVVAVHLDDDVLTEAIDAAGWADTALVIVLAPGFGIPDGVPSTAVIVEVDDTDDSGAGSAIGRYAAALDRGETARDAYDVLLGSVRS